jgi:Flp pilus assembly protein TadD
VLEFESNAAAALPEAAKAAADDPSLPFAQLVYGRALVDTGDPEAGLAHLQTVLQAEPQNLEAHITLAKVYSKLGRHDEARRERLLCLQMVDQSSRPAGEGSSATP